MDWLVWIGAAVSLAGLFGIFWCIAKVARAKRAGLDDEALRAVVQSVIALNLGAFFLSFLGLMLVGLGVFFG